MGNAGCECSASLCGKEGVSDPGTVFDPEKTYPTKQPDDDPLSEDLMCQHYVDALGHHAAKDSTFTNDFRDLPVVSKNKMEHGLEREHERENAPCALPPFATLPGWTHRPLWLEEGGREAASWTELPSSEREPCTASGIEKPDLAVEQKLPVELDRLDLPVGLQEAAAKTAVEPKLDRSDLPLGLQEAATKTAEAAAQDTARAALASNPATGASFSVPDTARAAALASETATVQASKDAEVEAVQMCGSREGFQRPSSHAPDSATACEALASPCEEVAAVAPESRGAAESAADCTADSSAAVAASGARVESSLGSTPFEKVEMSLHHISHYLSEESDEEPSLPPEPAAGAGKKKKNRSASVVADAYSGSSTAADAAAPPGRGRAESTPAVFGTEAAGVPKTGRRNAFGRRSRASRDAADQIIW